MAALYMLLSANVAYSQDSKEKARQKGQLAIALMDDEHKYDAAIKLLEEAGKLAPGNIDYPYEIAYAYNAKAEYKKACSILEQLQSHPGVHGQVYQFLGNIYERLGQKDKAIATYEAGLKKFPEAGGLYMELGNINIGQKNYNKALAYFERGIKVDPRFAGNYYWAAKIYCSSPETVWGMIYGEIFMNMERGTARTEEISRLLYETYRTGIQLGGALEPIVSFSKSSAADAPGEGISALPSVVYGSLLTDALTGEQAIDLASLNRIRSRFLESYFGKDRNGRYPNILFDYQQQVKEAGYLEAYNYWVLGKGADEAFNRWKANNDELWKKFMDWFGQNKLQVDAGHTFHREQY